MNRLIFEIILDTFGVITAAGMLWVIHQHKKQRKADSEEKERLRKENEQLKKASADQKPISNAEADYQRWKAERESREG